MHILRRTFFSKEQQKNFKFFLRRNIECTRTIASYYSLDGKEWQMVRLYRNNYPKDLKVGICSQAPQKGVCVSEFSELSLSTETVGDFRMGE